MYVCLWMGILAVCNSYLFRTPRVLVTKRFLFGTPEPPKNQPPAKNDGGLFGNMGNMMENLKKAQELAKEYERSMKELSETSVTATDPSGQVTATFTGVGTPVGIKVSESIAGQSAEVISAAATQAMMNAHAKAHKEMAAKLKIPVPPGQQQ